MGARLRWARRAVAALFLLGLAATFTDFRNLVPDHLGHVLASLQFVPSALSLLTGASLSVVFIVFLALTLAVGRIYCGAICPLGLLQDAIRRLARLFPGAGSSLRFTPAHTWVRQGFLWGTVGAILLGWGGLALAILDPYSQFGRFFSALVRPAVTLLNNGILRAFPGLAAHGWYLVDVTWASVGVISIVLGVLSLIAVMSALRGRLYCNTVCPVGTLLGFVSRYSAFRLKIQPSACSRCAECFRVCRAQCIDLRTRKVDHSRCVSCFDCLNVCTTGALSYEFSWKRPRAEEQPAAALPKQGGPNFSAGRRAFVGISVTSLVSAFGGIGLLAGAHAGRGRRADEAADGEDGHERRGAGRHAYAGPLCPPGSENREAFLSRCTACQLCVGACPTRVLQPSFLEYGIVGLMKPRLDFASAFCNFDCTACGDVCPTGAIQRLVLEEKQLTRIGVAQFHRRHCIVEVNGTDCAACSEHCPTKAVHTVPFRDNLRLPEVDEALCIGCGACEFACPVQPHKAITVSAKGVHERAEKAREGQATAPKSGNDFPF